jgi:glucose-1-phosphate cytidylyltransferase
MLARQFNSGGYILMKAVILAGGLGSRLSEETHLLPKPLVEIGGRPILWHILKIYSFYGINQFIICCGYKGYLIKEYFSNYLLHMSDITFDMINNRMNVHCNNSEPWQVTLVDTGEKTMTGGRLKRVKNFIGNETFCLTYGDGVGNININELIKSHFQEKTLATLTAVQMPSRFGALELSNNKVIRFQEKPQSNINWVNGGFFVLEPGVFEYIVGDYTIWEEDPLSRLASEGQLATYKHNGYWQMMDTLWDKNKLEELWNSGQAPWRIWE